jgi:hypothetical protein
LRLGSVARQPQHDRRKVARTEVTGEARVETSSGESALAQLRDFSPFGCNLRSDAEWLRANRFVTIEFSTKESVQAIVRWSRDGSAGVEFLRPLAHDSAEAIAAVVG